MGKITINELSNSLKDHIDSKQDATDSLLETNDKTIVGAINELLDDVHGKDIIANAIGEPLTPNDSFETMGNNINGLLSTFKTNMMNNGITVESSDKFKQLIEKIKGLTEGEGNKGIQFAEGLIGTRTFTTQNVAVSNYTVITNLGFTPSIVFIGPLKFTQYHNLTVTTTGAFISNLANTNPVSSGNAFGFDATIKNVTSDSFNFYYAGGGTSSAYTICNATEDTKWYAIGVGEEDTTLRDSLASILQEEGVSVTEEDDMASLITKVDEEFEDIKNTLAELMQKGGYDITGEEGIDSLLELLTAQGITVNDVKQICCGTYHVCIVKKDGSLWTCGLNDKGQLGLGDDNNRTMFNQVTTNINNDVKQIACGQYHTLLLKNDGSLWACGSNTNGQLGLGSTTNYKIFNKVTTNINSDVKEMACGDYHTFILKNDGSLWSCGNNKYGQLGLGTNDSDIHSTFTQVTTNINNDVKQIACGDSYTFILKNDGSLWSCGYNQYSRLGLGDTDDRTTFTQVTTNINNDVKQVACGKDFTLILKTNGSLWSCGRNDKGQLGLGDTTNRNTFTQVTTNINNDVKQIACGNNHTVILKNDGSLWGCGSYFHGQLGIDAYNTTNGKRTLVEIINKDIAILSVNCGGNVTFITLNNGYVLSCGSNGNGQLGINSTSEVKPVFTMSSFKLF